jgi:uncharacterized protein (DUF2235 family)
MGKNILIFSDGTGQRGGVALDERRTNIYKLYRATRCGPDVNIDPSAQLAYYDPGIGSLPPGLGMFEKAGRWLYNMVSGATGLGLTANIIDCYAAIIRMWEPGDRIFLFGFSRGAYTVRCVGGVLALCGVPTMKNGAPLRRDPGTTKKIAKEAVRKVYQHVSSPKDKAYYEQRAALARAFREKYGSADGDKANAYPYFIGVFDTVASLGSYLTFALLAGAFLAFSALASWALWFLIGSFWMIFAAIIGIAAVAGAVSYLVTHIKFARGLEGYSFRQTLHLTDPKMKFYDQQLNDNVPYARHALSLDENRADFPRVPWGSPKAKGFPRNKGDPEWFEQIWFAGNHSDIGGSHPENESRLSDIAFKWMTDAARGIPNGILTDDSLLQLYPSPAGMQHDERKIGWIGRFWKQGLRAPVKDATLHPSVYERFNLDAVLHYDEMKPYRPECLRAHEKLAHYYEQPSETPAPSPANVA